jgi:hypothetical protein
MPNEVTGGIKKEPAADLNNRLEWVIKTLTIELSALILFIK